MEVHCYETAYLQGYWTTLREQQQFVLGQCIVQGCELAWCFALSFFCFIFSLRHEALHFANADCEHRRWLLKRVF